ncbi:Stk1 family PASTA domain-containing Ser/Thr kinase [Schumannella sp. 10F1B-5-1]|uniref:Stk1 family PASTA domain-containing Ser/Thr kinase n=1 Tax=Schumannella sp. 10F1B-5-1 TaxID=2590780 RepID=UPI001132939F|nr:Stk1 family PASTA domain-containing Ser/Thr kinase [Schumannella sp. 10F1B-5-1]TPW76731.1 Stk1 family PASTA domain-containing Ser/Thr kinase [Schumannella sp. 10F1B-5-1]
MSDSVTEGVRVLAGRYQLGELLGRGGMADVYLGLDARLGRRVAVKLLKPSLANDPTFRTRFRQEAQSAARMAHPTIVRVYDAGEETATDADGVEVQIPFIVMEHVQGTLLTELIAKGPTAPAEAVRIVDGVLTALEYSHRAGVVHRDIKPGNIMVTSNGQVKVMDFGIARAISESQATIAQTSAILGTAQYFSPEQARGESVDARTDLYSTGVVLYELLTGKAPFRADSAVAVAYQHVSEAPVAPNALVPAISPALNAVVMRSLAKNRDDRYQSASDFRGEVDIAAEGKVPSRTAARSDDFDATLFGVGSGGAPEETLRRLANDDEDRAPRTTQSRPPVAWIWAGVLATVIVVIAAMVWVFSIQGSPLQVASSVKVPDVAGQDYDSGSRVLTSKNLTVQRTERSSTDVPEGSIIRTEPRAGRTVGAGEQILIYVSSGPQPVTVPSVLLRTVDEATQVLADNGLKLGETTQAQSPNVPAGQVISTNPTPGTPNVDAGSKIDIVVSTGTVDVPDVRGKSITEAQQLLSGADLQLMVSPKADNGCTGQTVKSQSIVGEQPQGSTVELVYCAAS